MKKSQSSDYINGLEKSLGVDKEGNLTAGKNLEVDGAIKLNGGLEPIHIYNLPDGFKLVVLFEKIDDANNGFIGIGFIQADDESKDICLFSYSLTNGEISDLRTIESSGNVTKVSDSTFDSNDFVLKNSYAEQYYQAKTYTHTLTLTAGTNNYVLVYDSTNNTSANNIQNLRTLMNVISASDNVILPVVNPTDLSTAGLQVTTSICKIGTANVTAVTDKVTSL